VTAAAEFFAALPERLSAGDGGMGEAVIAFALEGAPEGGWTVRLGGETPEVAAGVAPADVTVTCTRALWEQLCDHRVSPQTAWATGVLDVAGDMRLAPRLRAVLEI
jgi:putative sterol carrier protein